MRTTSHLGGARGRRIEGTSPSYTVALCIERSWTVCLACDQCERPSARWTDAQLTRLPAAATLGDIAARAKCGACGSTDGTLYTLQGAWGAQSVLARG